MKQFDEAERLPNHLQDKQYVQASEFATLLESIVRFAERLEWGCCAVQVGAVESVCNVLLSHMEDGILVSSCLRALALRVRCGARESDDVCSRMLECTKTFLKNCEAGPSATEELLEHYAIFLLMS